MKNKIIVIVSSHYSDEENILFEKHIKETIGCKHNIFIYENHNEFSLTELYNKAHDEHYTKNSIMVYCHNDIEFRTKNWGRLLLTKFNNTNYSIIGLAGSTYISESGVWWEDKSKMVGIVDHTNGISTWTSEYSNHMFGKITDVVVVDGVFFAVDWCNIKHKFNEEYGGFHFYDVSFSFENWLGGCDIGVTTDIRILHKSIGETNEKWDISRKKFIEEYKYELPIKQVSEDRLKILICCQFFKNLTGSELSVYELSKSLIKLGHDVTILSTVVGNPLYDKAIKENIKVFNILHNPPNYKIINEKYVFHKNELDFDIIHINHKPIGNMVLELYKNIPCVMHVRSEVIPIYEEPILNPRIKKYISIRDSVTEYIKSFGIENNKIILIENPFDVSRFNTDYIPTINEKKIVLFVGTLDYLREKVVYDLIEKTKQNNRLLWIIGADNSNYLNKLLKHNHVKCFGVVQNVEDYIKKVDYTSGIFNGRTTIEGFLCGKPSFVYEVDKDGNILNNKLIEVPNDLEKYNSEFSAKRINKLYLDSIFI